MNHKKPITLKSIFDLWAPLAGSWFLMGVETPMLTAFVARMAAPEITLAAWGSLIYPISLAIEGPIIMLLTASTALANDRLAYQTLFRYMVFMSLVLSVIHLLIAFTPLYYLLAEKLLKVPQALVEPSKIGLQIMTPWTFMIAWRRLNQGVMIKFGSSKDVAIGTTLRLLSLVSILSIGYWLTGFSGVVIGASAVAISVTVEAFYAQMSVQSILKNQLPISSDASPITLSSFTRFYLPLAITPLMTLLIHPAGSAGMSRMPQALSSLAAWPVVYGLVFLTRAMGFAFNEVVVSLAEQPYGKTCLNRFAKILALSTIGILVILAFTPLGEFWFKYITGLSAELAQLASITVMFAILMPGYQVYQSLYGGFLVHHRKTKGISEAVIIYVSITLIGLWAGSIWAITPGIYWAINTFVIAGLCQTFFLRYRYRQISI